MKLKTMILPSLLTASLLATGAQAADRRAAPSAPPTAPATSPPDPAANTAREAGSGNATGRRQYKPIIVQLGDGRAAIINTEGRLALGKVGIIDPVFLPEGRYVLDSGFVLVTDKTGMVIEVFGKDGKSLKRDLAGFDPGPVGIPPLPSP